MFMSDISPVSSPFRSAKERVQDRALKRDAVLRAAVRMFNERGFHSTSLDDVAASLGVTKPLIYHYLGGKEQVLFECVRIGLEQLSDAVAMSRTHEGTGLERLKAFLRRYAECIMDDFGRCVIRTSDEALRPDSRLQFRALKAEIDKAMRNLLEECVADGSARVQNIKLTAFAYAGALNWPARWHRPGGKLETSDIAAQIVEILLAGIVP
jgi:AcrR family transcriptional regulator